MTESSQVKAKVVLLSGNSMGPNFSGYSGSCLAGVYGV